MIPSPFRLHPLVGVVCLSALLIAATVGAPAGRMPSGPVVPRELLAEAIGPDPLAGGLSFDELRWFEARRAEDPADLLALRRLTALRLRRFRAYGGEAELAAASATQAALRSSDPRDATTLALEAALSLANHDFPGALEAAVQQRRMGDPSTDAARLVHFDALWAAGRYDEARRLLESGSKEESMARLARSARLMDGLGDTGAAARAMERVVHLSDAYAEPLGVRAWARVEHGNFLLHSGQPAAAAARYREALALVPALPAALEGLGWLAWGVDEDPDVAEPLFTRALTVGAHLDLYRVLEELARVRGEAARGDELRETFLDAAGATPGLQRLHRRPLALALAEDDARLEEALALADADLAARQDRMAWATRGWILHRMGRHAEAAADMDRALAWGAPEPEVLYRAGVVLLGAGQRRRGRLLLARALDGRAELGPALAREIEAMLEGHPGR